MKKKFKNYICISLIFLVAFITMFKWVCGIVPEEKNCFTMELTNDTPYESNSIVNNYLTSEKSADLYRISPFTELESGDYKLYFKYKTDVPVLIKACYVSEYDADTNNYPITDIGVLLSDKTDMELDFENSIDAKHVIF